MKFAYCLSLACSNFGKYEHRLSAMAPTLRRKFGTAKYHGSDQEDFASGITRSGVSDPAMVPPSRTCLAQG
jgi:hypothetical protein